MTKAALTDFILFSDTLLSQMGFSLDDILNDCVEHPESTEYERIIRIKNKKMEEKTDDKDSI